MVASWAAALGVDMGGRTVPADSANPLGYFEDVDFLELNRAMLATCVPTVGDGGHPDWGWTESEKFDSSRLSPFEQRARALLASRTANRRPWGWKDPRTTLLLDFWDGVDPAARIRYLLLYRFPWDVADSMQRLGADVFLRHPGYAYRIWAFYNRKLLEFHERHPDDSLLLSADALRLAPEQFPGLLRKHLGLEIAAVDFEARPAREQYRAVPGDDPLVGLVALAWPGCTRILGELDRRAALPSTGLWTVPLPGPVRKAPFPEEDVDLSVVIPCYNQGELLLEAVASAERSAGDRSELIIVNDDSDDPRTREILGLLRSVGYRILDQEHLGLSAARNAGIRLAQGRFILPLDDDNRIRPWFVEEAVRILSESREVDVVYGDRREFGKRSGRIDVPEFDLDTLLNGNYIDACAVYRKEVWEATGGYDTSLSAWEDWEFWIAAGERNRGFRHLPGIAFDYRVRPDSLVTTCDREDVAEALYQSIVAKHRGLFARRLARVMTERKVLVAECGRLTTEHSCPRTESDKKALRTVELISTVSVAGQTGGYRDGTKRQPVRSTSRRDVPRGLRDAGVPARRRALCQGLLVLDAAGRHALLSAGPGRLAARHL